MQVGGGTAVAPGVTTALQPFGGALPAGVAAESSPAADEPVSSV